MGLKHQAVAARKWRSAVRQIESHFPEALPPILFLTDPERVANPVTIIKNLPPGSGVIYRHFGAKDAAEAVQSVAQACAQHAVKLLIAADPVLAVATKADGVHWPERRLHQAAHWRGQFSIQTSSAHSPDAIRRAARAGMDAVLVSTVFPSLSPSAGRPMGPLRLRRLVQMSRRPIYALGGVTAENAGQIAAYAGVASVQFSGCSNA